MGLSGDAGFAAEFHRLGDGTGARDKAVAAFDDEVGIGADHRDIAPGKRTACAIVFGGFGLVVEEAGADDDLGVLGGNHSGSRAVEQRQVAFRAEEVDLLRTRWISARVTSPEVTIRS